ncbi:MAG: hypothetical protein ACRDV8_13065, partial [Acidimicrobiales bacterium]
MTSANPLFGDNHIREENLGEILASALRLLKGAIAVEYIPPSSTQPPVVWADLAHAAVTAALHTVVTEQLAAGGPWGVIADGPTLFWIEPMWAKPGDLKASAVADGAESAGKAVKGALAIAFHERSELSPDEIEMARVFARLANALTVPVDTTRTVAKQRRLDDLVSTISERLMSTTGPTLQSALDWAVEVLGQYLGADVAFLRRNDHARGMSVLMGYYPPRGIPLKEDPLGIVPFDSDPIFAATKDLKVPFIVRTASETDDRYRQRVQDAGAPPEFTGAGVP